MTTVLILGASADRTKFGNKSLRAFQQKGFAVYPVNPREKEIEGARVYPTIAQVPVRPNVVTVYLPPERLLPLLPDIAAKGCDELWLNPGTESEEVLAEAARLGLPVIQACSIVGLGMSPKAL
jgi:predicted CoA-binding protein